MLARDAHRFHEDARRRQRLHRLRCARGRAPCRARAAARAWPTAAPASALIRRWCWSSRGARTRGLLPHLQRRRRRGRAVRQRRALHRRAAARRAAARVTAPSRSTARRAWCRRGCPAPSGWPSTWACRTSTRARCLRCAEREADSYALEVEGGSVEIGAVSVGNPHAVLTRRLGRDAAPVAILGPPIERHPRFPRRVNVGFLEIVVARAGPPARLRARRGETRSCGTGACAAVAVARRRGLLDPEVRVSVRGGELRVNWAGPGSTIWLTRPDRRYPSKVTSRSRTL